MVARNIFLSFNMWRIIFIDLIFLFSVFFLYQEEMVLFIFLSILFFVCCLRLTAEFYREIIFFTFIFPLVEISCILFGVWEYTETSLLVIPLWLIPIWGQASLTILYLHNGLQKRLEKDLEITDWLEGVA